MRKFFKVAFIAGGALLGLVALLLAAAAVIIPIKYPPAKLKALAVSQLSQTLKRNVSIGDVHFNVFSGFEITKLAVSNRPGWAPGHFLTADTISISYHLLPLLWGEVSLGQVELKNFNVLLERRAGGQFNFSDMTASAPGVQSAPAATPAGARKAPAKKKGKNSKHKKAALPTEGTSTASTGFLFASPLWAAESLAAPAAPASKSGLLISVDSVKIVHGKMTYLDETAAPAQRSDLQDLNVTVKNISMVGAKSSFELDAPLVYNKKAYHLVVGGSLRYFMANQALKELQVKGALNDLAFDVAGSVDNLTDNFSPNLDGSASLDMLKFAGLIPNLSAMPSGLALTGPAEVHFHLGGDYQSGLKLSGTADATKLVLSYQDLFAKTASTTCKVDFQSVNQMSRGIYDVPSFKLTYDTWEVTGAFHYRTDGSFSGEVHSKTLPFQGLPAMIPKLKRAAFVGDGSVDLAYSKGGAKSAPLNMNGQIMLKGLGITLPNEPYLQNLTGPIQFTGNVIKAPGMGFSLFGGKGQVGVTYTIDSQAYSYALALKDVDAQKTIDASIDAYVTTKDYSGYKDKLYGSLNLSYAGVGRGISGEAMLASQVGRGQYSLSNSKAANLAVISMIDKYLKDPSNQIDFDQVAGDLSMKNRVFSYTAECKGKVGAVHVVGGLDLSTYNYSPNMKVQSDLRKSYVSSDAVLQGLSDSVRRQVKNAGGDILEWASDKNGNIPIDLIFTGPAADNRYELDATRLMKNIFNHLGAVIKNSLQGAAQDLGSKLKGLFGQ